MAEEPDEERPAFDEDPPIDPEEPRVGNSKAVFVQPSGEGSEDEDEEEDESEAAEEER